MAPSQGFTLFETPFGPCGIAWRERRLAGIQLPEADRSATRKKLLAQTGELPEATPPGWVSAAVARLVRHLEGAPQDLSDLALDLDAVGPFRRKVYEAARQVGPSRTVTYGELATLAGAPRAARAVGTALSRNPFPIVVPCHRVLAAGGKLGGFSSHCGVATKTRLLALEGVALGAPEKGISLFQGKNALGFDVALAMDELAAADPALAKIMERVGPFRLKLDGFDSPFAALLEAIVHQQLTLKAAQTILGRVKALTGGRTPEPAELLALSEDALRGAGLSRAKVASVRDLAAKTREGRVPALAALRALESEAIVEKLTEIRGIGRWTVEMLLIFGLGKADVLPATDYGIRKGFQRAFKKRELPAPRAILERGERWKPWRTVASWYLWRANELP
jgi:methylated-DNA-[protein]-cysteine S-methyltransferase